MHTIVVTMTSLADFADSINEMRSWLDAHCCFVSRFTCEISADTALLTSAIAGDHGASVMVAAEGGGSPCQGRSVYLFVSAGNDERNRPEL